MGRLHSCPSCDELVGAPEHRCPHCGGDLRLAVAPASFVVLLGAALTGCPVDDGNATATDPTTTGEVSTSVGPTSTSTMTGGSTTTGMSGSTTDDTITTTLNPDYGSSDYEGGPESSSSDATTDTSSTDTGSTDTGSTDTGSTDTGSSSTT